MEYITPLLRSECTRESPGHLAKTGQYWIGRSEHFWGSAFQTCIQGTPVLLAKVHSVRNKAPDLGNWLWLTWWAEAVLTAYSSQGCQQRKQFLMMDNGLSEQTALAFKHSHIDINLVMNWGSREGRLCHFQSLRRWSLSWPWLCQQYALTPGFLSSPYPSVINKTSGPFLLKLLAVSFCL